MQPDKQISMEAALEKYLGVLENPDGASDITGPCGDQMCFSFRLKEDRISEIRFKAIGCGVTLSCGAAVAFTADGLSLSEAMFISPGYILKMIGPVPADHKHCPLLAATSFYRAVGEYLLKTENKTTERTNAHKQQ